MSAMAPRAACHCPAPASSRARAHSARDSRHRLAPTSEALPRKVNRSGGTSGRSPIATACSTATWVLTIRVEEILLGVLVAALVGLRAFRAERDGERTRAALAALEQADGVRAKAARLLGMGRTTLWRKMKKYGID